MKTKALYILWPDFEYIDKCIEAGINTLLVTFHDMPTTPSSNYYDTWQTSVSVCERYKNSGLKIIAVPLWSRQWAPILEEQRFVQNGNSLEFTPCIINLDYMESRLQPLHELFSQGLIHEVVWDIEEYDAGKPGIIKYWTEKIKCECPKCLIMGITWKDAWLLHIESFKTRSQGLNCRGNLDFDSWWQLKRYQNNNIVNYTERTYAELSLFKYYVKYIGLVLKRLYNKLFYKLNYDIVAGAFIEVFNSPSAYLEYLERIMRSPLFSGYWIYTQKTFSRNSKLTPEQIEEMKKESGHYEERLIDQIDPEFFNKLKILNSKY
jgi:hypothetical protein